MEPCARGETLDVSESGLAWVSPEPLVPGDRLVLDAPAVEALLELPHRRPELVVCDLEEAEAGRYRVGARFVAPPDALVVALRKAMLRLQRGGAELDSHVVDVVALPTCT